MRLQRACQRGIVGRRRRRPCYYDNIEALEHRSMHAERFSDLTFDAVARDRLAGHPPRHGETEPGVAKAGKDGDREESVVLPTAIALYGGEVRRTAKPLRARQTATPVGMS